MTVTEETPVRTRQSRVGAADRSGRKRSPAAQRALDRRQRRISSGGTAARPVEIHRDDAVSRRSLSPMAQIRRIPFVGFVIGLFVLGLGLTLYLSTAAAQESYDLTAAREQNQNLTDQKNAIKKVYEAGNSAPELAKNASEKLGMVPATNVPRLVVGPDGRSRVIGGVTPAQGEKMPSMLTSDGNRPAQNRPAENRDSENRDGGSRDGAPAAPAAPADPASPNNTARTPQFSNVLPGNGGAPDPNSASRRDQR